MFSTSTLAPTARLRKLRHLHGASLFLCLIFCSVVGASGQTKFVGIWRQGEGGNALHRYDNWEDFVEKWQDLRKSKVRLRHLETVDIDGDLNYLGVWTAGDGPDALYAYREWDSLVAKWKELSSKGVHLVDVEVAQTDDGLRYIGVWNAGSEESGLFYYKSWEDFVAKWNELSTKDLCLVDIEPVRVGNATHYVGVWTHGVGSKQALYRSDDWGEFVAKWKELGGKDLRLDDVEVLRANGKTTYYGVWSPGTSGHLLFQFDSWGDFVKKWNELTDSRERLIDVAVVDYEKPSPPKPDNHGKPPQHGKPAQPGNGPGKPLYLDFTAAKMKKDEVTGLEFPAEMPAIVWPTLVDCNKTGFYSDKLELQKAWAMAHHDMWRAYQLVTYIEARSSTEDLWSHGYNANLGDKNWSPRAWFGPFADKLYRYQTVRDAIIAVWNERFLAKKVTFTLQCRHNEGGIHPCQLNNPGGGGHPPSANHIILGKINLCSRFFDDKQLEDRTRTLIHEMFHNLAPKGLVIVDTHTHSDWDGWCKTDTDKMYGTADALHLANSSGCWGSRRIHNEIAARNNDNYAYFILRLGSAIYDGSLKRFPAASFFD